MAQEPRSRMPDPVNATRPLGRSAVPAQTREPVALRSDTVDEFLSWAANTPHTQTSMIREAIAGAKGDRNLVDDLLDALELTPVHDFGRHLLLLATIGELQNEGAIARLEAFVWSSEPLFLPEPEESADPTHEGRSSLLDPTAALQARAAEMLSFHGTEAADAAILRLAAEHPERAVRTAAIDAHLYNHGDSQEAVQQLLEVVQPQDRKLVGLPRFSADMDSEEFDRRVLAFYDEYPEERPPQPPGLPDGPVEDQPPQDRGRGSGSAR